jgi:hypothetical protein
MSTSRKPAASRTPTAKVASEKIEVRSADEMLILDLRQHVQKRHPRMRFITKGEHAADHRLHEDQLDHVHQQPQAEEGEADSAEDED